MKPRFLLLIVALLLVCAAGFSQISTGAISGRVTDVSGAVIPNVKVTVINTATQFQFPTVTNAEGLFRVISLQPGPYHVTFEAAGFSRLVRENIELRTGEVLSIDAALQVGNVSESIEVTAAPQLLETQTSATGTVVSGEVVYKLPLYQRYINSTLLLVPGLNTRGFAYGGSLGAFNVAGQRSGQIGIFLDGVVGNDQMSGANTVLPIQNAVAEVKVLTGVPSAEYGHTSGGVIDVVKKTGTNEFHGMASVFGRTRSMQHRNYFDVLKSSQPRDTAPDGVMTLFLMPDANVGGPIRLPGIYDGRGKSFFFFSHQKLIDKQVKQFPGAVPTAAMKRGDFSFGGLGNPIYDPATTRQLANGNWTRDPFVGNVIPLDRIDPAVRRILALDPWASPNVPGSLNAAGPVDNLIYDRKGQAYFDQYAGRIDHQFNPYIKMYGSYEYYHQAGRGRPSNMRLKEFDAGGGQGGFGSYETPFTQQHYSVGNTWVLNPSLINDMRIGYYRRRDDRFVPIYNENWGEKLGIPNISPELIPAIGSGNQFTPETAYGFQWKGPDRTIGETLLFRNDLNKIHGVHAFKMGYEVLRHRLNAWNVNRPSGNFFFDGMTAGLQPNGAVMPRTGNTFAGFLTGYVRQATFDRELSSWLPRSWIHSFYFQDDWKVTPTLTLNLGVRYTNESPYSTKYGIASNFDPAVADALTGGRGGLVIGDGLNRRDNNNFQPRVGFAWHPLRKYVFRGGFAINTIDVKFPAIRSQTDELVAQVNQQRAPGDPRPVFRLSEGPSPVVYQVRQNGTSPFIGTNYGARNVDYWDPAVRNPYVMNWNFTVQRELAANYLLELAYQGSAGVGLMERWDINAFPVDLGASDATLRADAFRVPQNYRPFPHFGSIRMRSNFGHSTYHGGTVKLEKRYSQGFSLITFYTFSKAINSQDTDNSGQGVAPVQNRGLEKARAGYDRTHRWMITSTYELPVGKGKRFMNRGGVLDYVFGGWEIAWIQAFESGNPLTFSFANSPFNYFPTYIGDRRPNVLSQPELRDGWRELGGDRFNTNNSNAVMDMSYFAYPAAFTVGNAGRNIMTGLPLITSTVSAQKNFRISERFRFQLRWDMQNALKTYNFNPPSTTVDFQNPRTFGKLSGSPETASFGGAPLMNLTLKLSW